MLNSKSIPSNVKKYHEFCTFFGLKQLIKILTRTTISSSTIIDDILASYTERVTQCGVIDVSFSNYEQSNVILIQSNVMHVLFFNIRILMKLKIS